MDLLKRRLKSAHFVTCMVLFGLNAPVWAASGVIRSIQFDPGSHQFHINTSAPVHATMNTLDMYGRKRIIVDVENAEISPNLPQDRLLLQQLSRIWPGLRNISTYQYGGANWPIVRILLDLDLEIGGKLQDVQLTQAQGTSLELLIGATGSDYPRLRANTGNDPSRQRQTSPPTPSAFSPSPPASPPARTSNDLALSEMKQTIVRMNQRYDELLLQSQRMDQQTNDLRRESEQKQNRLSQQLSVLQAENASLKARLAATNSPKPPSSNTAAELNALRARLSRQISELQAENQSLKTSLASANAQKSASGSSSAELDALREKLSRRITELQAENTALKTHPAPVIKPADDTATSATAELNTLRNRLSRQISDLQTENDSLKRSLALATNAQKTATTGSAVELNVLRERLSGQISQLQDENNALKSELDMAKNAQNTTTAKAAAELNTLRDQLSRQVLELQNENNTLKTRLATATSTSKAVMPASQPNRATAELEELRNRLSHQITELRNENSTLKTRLAAASTTVKPAAPVSNISSELTALKKQLTIAQISLNESIRTINEQNKELASLRNQMSDMKPGEENGSKEQIEHLQSENTEQQARIRELQKQLEAKTVSKPPAPEVVKSGGKSSIAALRQEAETLKQQLETLRQENASLQERASATSDISESAEAERYYQIGKTAKAARQTEQAVDAFRQAQALAPNNNRYTIDYSAALAEAHRYPEGITLLTGYLGKNPTDREAYTQLGKLYLLNDQPDAAIQAFTHAMPVSTLNNYATSLKRTNRMNEAESVFKLALTLNPKDSEVLFNLGNLYNSSGKSAQAKEYYLKALALRPNFAEAHYNLGLIHAKLGDRTEAVAHLEKFIQLSPNARNTDTIRSYIEKLKTP